MTDAKPLPSDAEAPGPVAYENWRAAQQGLARHAGGEVPLFTDAQITGEITAGIGPYELLNTIAGGTRSPHAPAVMLRYWIHLPDVPSGPMKKTDVDRYHGGDLSDELAALVSLCMGIRLKAGGKTRRFGEHVGDPLGRPYSIESARNPGVPQIGRRPILPRCAGQHNLNEECALLATLPTSGPSFANALVRSARSYQEGLWVAESDPHLAWLLLVSAVETAGSFWRSQDVEPLEKMEASRPELVGLLRQKGDEGWLQKTAEQLAPYMGATKTFTDFLLTFLPERPPGGEHYSRHPWELKRIRDSLRMIYGWRSRALHDGVPFPWPMCEPPMVFNGVIAERPLGLATAAMGGTWIADDVPMLLHLFEHIVRGALTRWWAGMTTICVPDGLG